MSAGDDRRELRRQRRGDDERMERRGRLRRRRTLERADDRIVSRRRSGDSASALLDEPRDAPVVGPARRCGNAPRWRPREQGQARPPRQGQRGAIETEARMVTAPATSGTAATAAAAPSVRSSALANQRRLTCAMNARRASSRSIASLNLPITIRDAEHRGYALAQQTIRPPASPASASGRTASSAAAPRLLRPHVAAAAAGDFHVLEACPSNSSGDILVAPDSRGSTLTTTARLSGAMPVDAGRGCAPAGACATV